MRQKLQNAYLQNRSDSLSCGGVDSALVMLDGTGNKARLAWQSQANEVFPVLPKASIARLREEVEKLGGNTMSLESMPADMEEEFLRHVLEYESAEPISLLQLLTNSGLAVSAPDELDDEPESQAFST